MKREGMLLRALSVMGAISLGAGFSACDDSDTGTTDTGVECTSNDDCEAGEVCNEDNICVEETTDAECGNGVVEADEVCDDGEDNGTPGFCSDDCSEILDEEAVCGDGEVEGDEVCDDGEDNGTPGFCNSNCDGTVPADCGDGTVQEGEECDDGNDVDTDACTNECTNAVCGDGIIQDGVETCDDGEDNGTPNNCNATCDGTTAAICGNEVVETGEDCDSGGVQTADCEADCTSPTCGDGVLNEDAGETCDDGEDNGTPNNCNNSCDGTTSASCGNGTVESGEDCDDAGESATCNADCSAASCGDGVVNATAGETCDDGTDNGTPNNCNATCDGTTAAVCGNSVIEAGEDCDDGGESATCDANCSTATCGDGTVNATAGETCDDGTDNGTPNNCNSSCDGTTAAVCGNSVVEAGEDCDDGGNSASCDNDCTAAVCGDEFVNPAAGESCDDGDLNGEPNQCNSSCNGQTGAVCGNGTVEAGEDCDDGGESATCDANCSTATCGDGTVNATAGETCDDGTDNGTPNNCNSSCDGTTAAVCGNSVIESGETCDDGGESATCNDDCTAASCGDGVTNTTAGEQCDDAGESASCNADCTTVSCGDGIVNSAAGETCDDGSDNGTPNNCNSTCDGTTAAVCGNSVVESGEDCDDGGESATCNSDCSAATCGDGVTNAAAGEQCDDAGESASCDADCTNATCGDENVNTTAGETCDDGADNGTPNNCNSTCDGTTPAVCGNSVVESGEDCDTGGQSATCEADCSAPVCGDGTLNELAGEECDDGNTTSGDGCEADCSLPTPTGFRLNSLVLRDPHIYVSLFGILCENVTNDGVAGQLPGGINGLIDDAIQEEDPDNAGFYGLSFLISLLPLDQTNGATMDGTVEFPECTFADPSTCTRDTTQPVVMADVASQTSGQCLGVLSGTTDYTPAPTTASAGANGCFVSEEVTVTVSIADIPITLQSARVAARYDGDPASGLVNGLLRGFLTEADADGIALPDDLPLIGGDPLSSVLPGGGACGGGDARDSLGGVSGWWFYLNFTAESVNFVIP